MNDFENDASAPKGVSRRTVVKGAAWAVPVVAVAATVPLVAASPVIPPPPVFNWADGCATVGNGEGGCNGQQKTGQVPVALANPSAVPLVFQFVDVESKNTNSAVWTHDFTVYTNNGTEDNCSPQITTTGCGDYISVTVPAGGSASLWVVSGVQGSAGAFDMNITYRWIEPCTSPAPAVVVSGPTPAGSTNIGSSNNCNGSDS